MARLADIDTWRERAPHQARGFKCCYVCGEPDGVEATHDLILAGYRVPSQAIAWAHPACLQGAKLQHLRHLQCDR